MDFTSMLWRAMTPIGRGQRLRVRLGLLRLGRIARGALLREGE